MSTRPAPGVQLRIVAALALGPQLVDGLVAAGCGSRGSIQNQLTLLRREGTVRRVQASGGRHVCVYWLTNRSGARRGRND